MYKPYLEVRNSSKGGFGVFTKVDIPKNSKILEFGGDLLDKAQIKNKDASEYLQIGPESYLSLSGSVDDYINHSCSPTSFLHIVGNRAFLYSTYVIKAGNEITFDYSTSSTQSPSEWQMKCNCGSRQCRQTISGFQHLDKSLQQEYRDKGMLPLFISTPIFVNKK